jgi:ligand-binding sensor domain-containing protein
LFGTTSNTFIYNGKTFVVFTHEGKPFTNVRTIKEDKKGNIWLGGHDGLWRYDGKAFTNFTENFVGSIYEDKRGNIWTGSENAGGPDLTFSGFGAKSSSAPAIAEDRWTLSRYDEKSLSDKKPTVKEIKPKHGMICGVLEANDGSIWFGASDGVYRYDGNSITGFNSKKGQK